MRIWFALLVAGAGLITTAAAAPTRLTVSGHIVEIVQDVVEKLTVDNKEMLEDLHIDLGKVIAVDGVNAIVGSRQQGGNACLGVDFILSFPMNGPVRLDQPEDTCFVGETTTTVEQRRIVMEIAATPQAPGLRWVWTPAAGLGPETKIAFVPRSDDGWAALRARTVDHPARIFDYADLDRLIDARVGPMRRAALRISSGPGAIKYDGNLVIASACQSHACDETALLIVADVAARTFYVALKDPKSAPVISPRPAEWPKGAKAPLLAFQKRWLR